MIVFNLSCSDCDFSFEGWFENTKDYNKQIKQGRNPKKPANTKRKIIQISLGGL